MLVVLVGWRQESNKRQLLYWTHKQGDIQRSLCRCVREGRCEMISIQVSLIGEVSVESQGL